MEQQNNVMNGHVSLLVSILAGIFGWLDSINMEQALKMISIVVSIVAGLIAIGCLIKVSKNSEGRDSGI